MVKNRGIPPKRQKNEQLNELVKTTVRQKHSQTVMMFFDVFVDDGRQFLMFCVFFV